MKYYRLCKSTHDYGTLLPQDANVFDYVKDNGEGWYKSLYYYNDDHFKKFKDSKTVAGITDVVTNRLVWDFDSLNNLDLAKQDALELCSRLITKGINQDQLRICFSGQKGFSVEVETNKELSPEDVGNINTQLAKGLSTNDSSITNAARILRIENTKHQTTKLYKFPLTLAQLSELTVPEIKEKARDLANLLSDDNYDWSEVELSNDIYKLRGLQETKVQVASREEIDDIDFAKKPKFLSNCKFAVMNGFYEQGCRSYAMMSLAASFASQGFPKEITYRALKGAQELAEKRKDTEPLENDYLWKNVIGQVYSPTWKGGTYSCKDDQWLKQICEALPVHHRCRHAGNEFISVSEIGDLFKTYSKNIEKNTIKTGIERLDEHLQMSIGMSVGLLGTPGSGKTSLALNILNNTSKAGIKSAFFSMDMYHLLVFQKMLQRHTGMPFGKLVELIDKDESSYYRVVGRLAEEYKNMRLYYRSGYSMEDIRTHVLHQQQELGEKVKLIVIDYLECIQGPYSDSLANTSMIANQLKDLANELETCVVTLVQPQKSAGAPNKPLLSMRQVKGSSTLEQAFSIILGIYREGFNPERPQNDRFMTINSLKNRMGPLFSVDCGWEGLTGNIRTLTSEEEVEFEEIRGANRAILRGDQDDSEDFNA